MASGHFFFPKGVWKLLLFHSPLAVRKENMLELRVGCYSFCLEVTHVTRIHIPLVKENHRDELN